MNINSSASTQTVNDNDHKVNCYLNNIIHRYIHIIVNNYKQTIPIPIPLDIINIINAYSKGKDGTLIVESNNIITLKSDYQYEFTFVLIKSNATLTVNAWNQKNKNGGKLIIKSLTNFIIKKNGKITLNGKGYIGGWKGWTGESYNKPSLKQSQHNLGGGGGGTGTGGSGGGYGSNGEDAPWGTGYVHNNGGITYGDKELSILHLGSGGGGFYGPGGNGGGAIKIECIHFENNGQITANDSYCDTQETIGGGGGSGGSIFIICNDFNMDSNDKQNCFIRAIGGDGGVYGGNGGDGRIRIKSETKFGKYDDQIKPSPYIG